jgi:hypothetical protein
MAANWTAFAAGNVLTAAQLNGVVDNFADTAIFNETQASGTAGGTFTSGSFVKRTLNTTVVNNIAGCTLTSSVIALPAGTYQILATAPGGDCTNHKAKLRNTTDSTDELIGTSERAANGTSDQTRSFVVGVFTIAATKNFELQHRCSATSTTNGLGYASTFGVSEVYSQVTITRIA